MLICHNCDATMRGRFADPYTKNVAKRNLHNNSQWPGSKLFTAESWPVFLFSKQSNFSSKLNASTNIHPTFSCASNWHVNISISNLDKDLVSLTANQVNGRDLSWLSSYYNGQNKCYIGDMDVWSCAYRRHCMPAVAAIVCFVMILLLMNSWPTFGRPGQLPSKDCKDMPALDICHNN